MLALLLIPAVLLGAYACKTQADKKLKLNQRTISEDGVIGWQLHHNYGLVGNGLEKKPAVAKIMATAALVVVTIMLCVILPTHGKAGIKAGLALVVGGGLSNLLERYLNGYVTDYMIFDKGPAIIKKYIYNIADFCLFVGAVIALISAVLEEL